MRDAFLTLDASHTAATDAPTVGNEVFRFNRGFDLSDIVLRDRLKWFEPANPPSWSSPTTRSHPPTSTRRLASRKSVGAIDARTITFPANRATDRRHADRHGTEDRRRGGIEA
jgi:hypothetical protein